MKLGDKVRFLSDTGGGIVAGFQGKNIVLVEDSDGFQIPTPVNEVVVVDGDNYGLNKSISESVVTDVEEDYDPADRPVTYNPRPIEIKGGDKLSVYLAFVPANIKEITKTKFESYLINDSNYYVNFAYMSQDGDNQTLRKCGEIEPNTKIFIEDLEFDMLGEIEHVAVQLISFKREKTFALQPTADVRLRIDTVKFYKLHPFKENDFFDEPAIVYPIVKDGNPVKPLSVDTKKIEESMIQAPRKDHRHNEPARMSSKKTKNDIVVTDLHATELLETTAGMSSSDILNYQLDVFRKTLNSYRNKKGTRLVFIHGKGEGVLRKAILKELKYKFKKYPVQDASFQEYGYGATQVTII